MKTRTFWFLFLILMLLTAAVTLWAYPRLPDIIPTHWNAQGQADDFSEKSGSIWILPIMMVGVTLLLVFLPKLDPLRKNVALFSDVYYAFVLVVNGFFLYLHLLTLWIGMGSRIQMVQWMVPAYAGLCACCGWMVGRAKPNWFIGLRTPWTLSDERVWDQTHALGRKTFYLAAAATLPGIFWPKAAFLFLIGPLLVASFIPVIYSYFLHRKLHSKP